MAARHSPVRWVLILLVVGLVGVGVAVATWWPQLIALGPAHREGGTARATATVLTSVPCGGPDARDEVAVRWAGHAQNAQLDGCGHRLGEVIEVDVPANPPANGLIVRIAGTSVTGNVALHRRVSVVLFVLSAVSGAAYAYLIRTKRRRVPPRLGRRYADGDRVGTRSGATGSRLS